MKTGTLREDTVIHFEGPNIEGDLEVKEGTDVKVKEGVLYFINRGLKGFKRKGNFYITYGDADVCEYLAYNNAEYGDIAPLTKRLDDAILEVVFPKGIEEGAPFPWLLL